MPDLSISARTGVVFVSNRQNFVPASVNLAFLFKMRLCRNQLLFVAWNCGVFVVDNVRKFAPRFDVFAPRGLKVWRQIAVVQARRFVQITLNGFRINRQRFLCERHFEIIWINENIQSSLAVSDILFQKVENSFWIALTNARRTAETCIVRFDKTRKRAGKTESHEKSEQCCDKSCIHIKFTTRFNKTSSVFKVHQTYSIIYL